MLYPIPNTNLLIHVIDAGYEVLEERVAKGGKDAGKVSRQFIAHFATLKGLFQALPQMLISRADEISEKNPAKDVQDLVNDYRIAAEKIIQTAKNFKTMAEIVNAAK